MVKVTPAEEIFCQEIAKGTSQYESYCIAYPRQAKGSSRPTLDKNAYAKLSNTKIISRVEELRAPAMEEFNLTMEELLGDITALKKLALKEKDSRIALDCMKEIGKLCGFYTTQIKDTTDHAAKLAALIAIIAEEGE